MSKYDSFYESARKLIIQFGKDYVLTSPSGGLEYDPATGETLTPETPATITVYGVSTNYNAYERSARSNKTNTTQQEGDKKMFVSCKIGEKPALGMMVTINGEQWRINDINDITPTDMPIIYICHISRT